MQLSEYRVVSAPGATRTRVEKGSNASRFSSHFRRFDLRKLAKNGESCRPEERTRPCCGLSPECGVQGAGCGVVRELLRIYSERVVGDKSGSCNRGEAEESLTTLVLKVVIAIR